MSDDPRNVQLEGLLSLVIELVLDRIHGMDIGQVSSYDKDTQKATVQPLVQKAHVAEDESRVPQTKAPLTEVPVWHLGAGKNRVTVPVKAGDYGLLLYSSLALDRWKQRGGVVDPGNDRRHDVSDAVFVPGIHDFGHVPTSAPDDAIVIHVEPGVKIKLGSELAAESIPLGNTLSSELNSIITACQVLAGAQGVYNAAIAAATPVLLVGGAASPAAIIAAATVAFGTACAAFLASTATYLSTKAKTEL